ncbi:hypothetical protein ACIQAC_38855 [Streptomyces sp. NPDC088387]|uniref:hypothetical protein n=1 Tax=Streptomyces sp. NPDC088387 TaxID=3365859 RepID=UPI0037FD4880
MRLFRSMAPVTLAVALVLTTAVVLVLTTPFEATPHARVEQKPEPFGAECRTTVQGSHVSVRCHNPYPATDRVRLHIECARWWDLDTDGEPADAVPATTVRLTGRCWKEVGSAWVSHQRRGS